MLIELYGRNFRSFRDDFSLSMLATKIDPDDERGVVSVKIEGDDEPLRLLRCAAIYGANASGKSTVLLAAKALGLVIQSSGHLSSDGILGPYDPFVLDQDHPNRPVMLGASAIIEGRVFKYKIEFTLDRFVREELVEVTPKDDVRLFLRQEQKVEGPWTKDAQFSLLTESFRPNALLLSLADRLAPRLARGIAVGFRRVLIHSDQALLPPYYQPQSAARRAFDDKEFGSWLVQWLQAADIGIVDYVLREMAGDPEDDGSNRAQAAPSVPRLLNLRHAGLNDPVELSFQSESFGTRKMLNLGPFIHELTHGETTQAYFIDEIGASLHPQMLNALIRRFNCETQAESVRGQLIFATHETSLMDEKAQDAVLRRDQIYFTEKDSNGASRLYSLAEYKERQNLNLRRRYLQGRYGALPAIGSLGD